MNTVNAVRALSTTHAEASCELQGGIYLDAFKAAARANVLNQFVLYRDTPTRAMYRNLINACVGLPDVVLAVSFIKTDGTPRTMLAQPHEANADMTKRYATVWDVEANNFRRINLDSIVKLSVETHTVVPLFPSKYM